MHARRLWRQREKDRAQKKEEQPASREERGNYKKEDPKTQKVEPWNHLVQGKQCAPPSEGIPGSQPRTGMTTARSYHDSVSHTLLPSESGNREHKKTLWKDFHEEY